MRDVGEQLAAHPVGRLQLRRALDEAVRHLVERPRDSGDLVPTRLRRARDRVAAAEPARGVGQPLQAAVGRSEDENGSQGAGADDQARCDEREDRAHVVPQHPRRAPRLHDDHPDRVPVDENRRERRPAARPKTIGELGGRGIAARRRRHAGAQPVAEPGAHAAHEARRRGPPLARNHPAVLEDDPDGPRQRTVAFDEVMIDVARGAIRLELGGDVRGDQRREGLQRAGRHVALAALDDPEEQRHLHGERGAEKQHEPGRDAPIEAAVPRARRGSMA